MGSLGDSSGMEVFVRGVPERITENELNKFFASSMERLKIEDWVCQKIGRKAFANIVFLRPTEGRRFLNKHGNMIGPGVETLVLQGRWWVFLELLFHLRAVLGGLRRYFLLRQLYFLSTALLLRSTCNKNWQY